MNVGVGAANSTNYTLQVRHSTTLPPTATSGHGFAITNDSTGDSWMAHNATSNDLLWYLDGTYKALVSPISGNWIGASDQRIKKNIETLSDGMLEKVLQLNPTSYNMKADKNENTVFGLIAQEVEEVFPEAVYKVSAGGELGDILTVEHLQLIPVLIKAMQEQSEKIDALEQEIQMLKK